MSLLEQYIRGISARSRKKKFLQFMALMCPQPEEKVLDVGVTDQEYAPWDNYLEKCYPWLSRITAVAPGEAPSFGERYPGVEFLQADGRALPFADNAFAVLHSNAVIEHVGGREAQECFLREMYRVARRGYVTTPNKYFPVEVHTRIPLLHVLLSKAMFDRVLGLAGKEWARGGYMELLGVADLRELCRRAGIRHYRMVRNRFLGFTLTLAIVWDKERVSL
ncbi:MAG: class I SAM-dependent methyltransferase [bacterium]|nr:class I SAM-dependent methyltransferase [bacterium]MDZ4296411.1 class I SAM-dependent methyltransferase [Patescibacteria group bacterium]